jgi:xanthine dehydrogenase YagR molybdenum-binding subunit
VRLESRTPGRLHELVDPHANVLGAKGVGELGNCGANAAVANAVFNATGVRVRDFPITIEKLLPGLRLLGA